LSLETIFCFLGVKILEFFDEDPGWRQFGSGINIPDPPHWFSGCKALLKGLCGGFLNRFKELKVINTHPVRSVVPDSLNTDPNPSFYVRFSTTKNRKFIADKKFKFLSKKALYYSFASMNGFQVRREASSPQREHALQKMKFFNSLFVVGHRNLGLLFSI
jgi:hypothetical protein